MQLILKNILFITVSLLFSLFANHQAKATHLRAGQLIIERLDCQGLTFRISFVIYKDTGGSADVGGGIMRFGDGSDPDDDGFKGILVPQEGDPAISYRYLGGDVAEVIFSYVHTYAAPGSYVVTYEENNRNAGILNIGNSVGTPFCLSAETIIDPFLGCNNSPVMLIPPVDEACYGVAFVHNPGAYDPDGDSLSFELDVPKQQRIDNTVFAVSDYTDPISAEFFSENPYSNEDGTGPPSITINPHTGEVYWDAPGDLKNSAGVSEYNIAIKISEWRKVNGNWKFLGFVVRDMQIIVRDCDNNRPDLLLPAPLCVEAGTLIDEDIFGLDVDGDSVKIEAFSQVFNMYSNSASYSPDNGEWQDISTAKVNFKWQTDCFHVRDQPYQVVFKITDNPVDGPKLVNFATWDITVIAPRAEWSNAQLDFATKSAQLEWMDYSCTNAQSLEIWRRVDSYDYLAEECETGMPDYLGYEMIDLVSPLETAYTDNNHGRGLDPGAQYCYRIVAVFSNPPGGESIISEEICVGPLLADAPVITHVTVDKTDIESGEITVSWKPPFEIDTAQFGTDYTYEIQRGTGLTGDVFTVIGSIKDTTYTDIGVNSEGNPYYYRIVLYSEDALVVSPTDPIDTSSVASSVWLQPITFEASIQLDWFWSVPWSNNVQDYPWHYIYRGEEGTPEASLTLIDSVLVSEAGYTYLDSGQWNQTPLDKNSLYCYYVFTQGSYGNPDIEEPQLNKSQMICVQPADDVPPCPPEMVVEPIDCDNFLETSSCGFTDYENTISWLKTVPEGCQDDVLKYEIYYTPSKGGEFLFLATVFDTTYVDVDLSSFARCYKVRAIDRSGNMSEFSEVACFENCPYYELPNLFTPENSDLCNDVFRAYSDLESLLSAGYTNDCGEVDETKCARFVQSVNLKIYNRWGGSVYDYTSGGEYDIYINWDGRDSKGRPVPSGTYYYVVDVVFDMVDPEKREQTFKGWVQIVR